MKLELSIIVPVLNEAPTLPQLFASLARQRETTFEVVICDGGSTDGTTRLAHVLAREMPFPVRVVVSQPGRAHQMNSGAAASHSAYLLFLHADSLFAESLALRHGIDALVAAGRDGNDRIAARFALRFNLEATSRTWAYYHLECKARLNRRECIHGDQGFLLRRSYFDGIGPFDPALPMLSETRLAEAVRSAGHWLLLPAEIHTSARRFVTEGLYERQLLNAIMMNFASLQWETFFREAAVYPRHDDSGRLQLYPLLSRIARLIGELPLKRQLWLWYATGAYVRSHAWQIPFLLDTRRNFRSGLPAGAGGTPLLEFYERYLDTCIDHAAGRCAAAIVTWLWFGLVRLHLRLTWNARP